jgi:type III secretory pathway component EscS
MANEREIDDDVVVTNFIWAAIIALILTSIIGFIINIIPIVGTIGEQTFMFVLGAITLILHFAISVRDVEPKH